MSVRKVVGNVENKRALLGIEINIVFNEEYPFVYGGPFPMLLQLRHLDFDEWEKSCCRESSPWIELKESSKFEEKFDELEELKKDLRGKLKDVEKKVREVYFAHRLRETCRKERLQNRGRMGPLEEEQMQKIPERQELAEKIDKISQQISAEKDNISKLRHKAFEEVVKPKLLELQKKIKGNQLLGTDNLVYLYKGALYKFDRDYSDEEMLLQILDFEDKERRKFERLKRKLDLTQQVDKAPKRETIPEEVRIAVWRRDEGKCSRCGNRKNLEYDHIIPISKGGSNTVRNIELLCEECNRRKKDNIE